MLNLHLPTTWHERLKSFREENNLSQAQLAKELKCSKQQIARFETGRAEPQIIFFKILVEKFEINLHWLLFGKGPKYSTTIGNRDELSIFSTIALSEELKSRERKRNMLIGAIKNTVKPSDNITPGERYSVIEENFKQAVLSRIPSDVPAWLKEDIIKIFHLED